MQLVVSSAIGAAECAIADIAIAISPYVRLGEEALAMRALLLSPRDSSRTKGEELFDTVSSSPVLSVGARIIGGKRKWTRFEGGEGCGGMFGDCPGFECVSCNVASDPVGASMLLAVESDVSSVVEDGCSHESFRESSSSIELSDAYLTRCNQFGGGVVDDKYSTVVNSSSYTT